ncbi:MAG: hypothetical protein IJ038_03175 [Clostridia bacterium]|nr:hypothetical protein [Clostridia bacterium]
MENTLLKAKPLERPVILGTDWHTDCDDAVAIRILAWAHKNKIIKLLGMAIDSAMEYSVSSLRAFAEYEGIPEVAIGLDHEAYDYGGEGKYHARLAEGRDAKRENDTCESALRLYRRLLAASDEKADIIEVGFSQVLADLLMSEADEFSPLDGMDLVRQKVRKLWIMGGRWDIPNGREFNFSKTTKASRTASKVLELCPVPITLLGWEVGYNVISGGILKDTYPDDKLYAVLCDYNVPNGRPSWDPLTAYMACVGDEELSGYSVVRGRASLDAETGCNSFEETSDGNHLYVVKKYSEQEYADCLEEIILLQAKEINSK